MSLILSKIGRAILPYAIGAIAMLLVFWMPYAKIRHDLKEYMDSVNVYKGKAGELALELAKLKDEKAQVETSFLRQVIEQERRYDSIRNAAKSLSLKAQTAVVTRVLRVPDATITQPIPTYLRAIASRNISYQLRQDTLCYDAETHAKLTGAMLELEQRRTDADTAALAYAQLLHRYQGFYVDVGEIADAKGFIKRRGPRLRKLLRTVSYP